MSAGVQYKPGALVDLRIGQPRAGVEWVPGIVDEVRADPGQREARYDVFTAVGVFRRCHAASMRVRREQAAA